MNRNNKFFSNNLVLFILVFAFVLSGCGVVRAVKETTKETVKGFWGSSTRALEEARAEALSKTYRCSFDECFDTVENFLRVGDLSGDVTAHGPFDIFIKKRKEGVIVVMGVKGNVDTTEVGVFISRYKADVMKLEVSSLSSSAKRRVAQAVFDHLDTKFEIAL